MAILKNGLWGGVTGKLGNTVCYVVNGKQVVRMNVKSTKPPTQKQLDKRAEMGIVNDFLRPIKTLVQIGFGVKAKSKKIEAYNIALGYVKKYALKGEGADRQIDYTKVVLSMGHLPNVKDPNVALTENVLTVSWSPGCNHPGRGSDRVMVLAYWPPTGQMPPRASFGLCGTERSRAEERIEVPPEWTGRPIEVYMFMQSACGKALSDSAYLGRW